MDKLLILNKIQDYYNFKKDAQFAEYLGIPAQNLSKWKLRNTYDAELIYTKCTEINPEWLLTGKGDMLKVNTAIKSYPKPDKKEKQLPLIPIEAIAGFGAGEFTIMEHDVLEYYKIPEFSNADFLIPVKGSSMQPKYYGGDLLACKHIQSFSFFQWGVPHVITIKDRGTVVKRIKQSENENEFTLISDNKKYEPFTITIDDIVNIAIVVGVIRVEN
jgi:phage repressor protein C with HTH and peptisase S24 domain